MHMVNWAQIRRVQPNGAELASRGRQRFSADPVNEDNEPGREAVWQIETGLQVGHATSRAAS